MLYIKMMAAQNMADTRLEKNFKIITVGNNDKIQFGVQEKFKDDKTPLNKEYDENTLFITREGADEFESYVMTGNVYIMNDKGTTIACRSINYDTTDTFNKSRFSKETRS